MNDSDFPTIADFDGLAEKYDAMEAGNPILQWMRQRVQKAALSAFVPGGRLLEVGCGTGTDALFFVKNGYRVWGIDPSLEMLTAAREKIAAAGFAPQVDWLQGGADELDELFTQRDAGLFDGIFSNFGALNCVANLRQFAHRATPLLNPGGKILLCLMPPVCPWEMAYYLLRLRGREAFRRWRGRSGTNGIAARVGDRWVQTYYHSRAALTEAFSSAFTIEKQFFLGLFVPPPYLLRVVARYPKFFNGLVRCEKSLAAWPILRNLGDHVVVILQKRMI
jgi:ubiquinone/menaquinone biosynthesis C-methylase UbiE